MTKSNPQFFVIPIKGFVGLPWEVRADQVEPIHRGDAPRCPACNRFIGMKELLPPLRFRLIGYGNELGDVADGGDWLVSDRFRSLVMQHGFTGMKFRDIEIAQARRVKVPTGLKFHLLSIERGQAAIDISTSEMEHGPIQCSQCRTLRNVSRWKRLILEEGTWDGLDAFVARGLPNVPWFTSRVKTACEEAGLKLFPLVPAESDAFDFYPLERT